MAKRSKSIICLSLCSLLLCLNFITAKAEALPDVMSGSTTLADNIMTYYALSGSAVANSDWINTLYSSYGSSFGTIEELADQGYLVLNDSGFWEPVQELGQMIEQAPAYSSLGLNEMFNVSAEEAAAGGGFAAASGGSILAGSLGGVASTGVVPLLGGVTAAYWGGIALGTLIAHGLGLYGETIKEGTPITLREALSNLPPNSSVLYSGSDYLYYSNVSTLYCVYDHSSSRYIYEILVSGQPNSSVPVRRLYLPTNDENVAYSISTNSNGRGRSQDIYTLYASSVLRPNLYVDSANSYGYAFVNNTVTPNYKKSPDLIGEDGNLQAEPDGNGGYAVPDYKPQIDPGTQAGKPLTLQDWQNFANAVQNNNNNVNPTPDGNKGLFDNILDLIRTVIPENVPNPNPNPNPDPWSPPVVTPVPDPTYPDPVPDQQITENPNESENPQQTEPLSPTDTGKPFRLPDLRSKFPFCIPWDIAKIFSKLKVNARQAPHISWRFNPPNTPIDYTFNLDLEDFEEVATLVRTLELMGFVVGLAFVTRYLIGAN